MPSFVVRSRSLLVIAVVPLLLAAYAVA